MGGAPYNNGMRKAEDVIKALVDQDKGQYLDDVPVYAGFGESGLESPRIEVICELAEPEKLMDDIDEFTGNWTYTIRLVLVTNYKDHNREQRSKMSGDLFDIVLRNNTATELNNRIKAADFHCYGGAQGAGESITPIAARSYIEEHEVFQELEFTLYGRPSE